MELGCDHFYSGIGLAVRTCRTEASSFCRKLTEPIVGAGCRMTLPAPDLFIPAVGLSELGQAFGLFDYEPSAAALAQFGVGCTATLYTPLSLIDDPCLCTERGVVLGMTDTLYNLIPGDVICFRSRPNSALLCHTAAPTCTSSDGTEYALPPNTLLTLEEVREPPWVANFLR